MNKNVSAGIEFVDDYVVVKWNNSNRTHYESLGYVFTGRHTELRVKVEDLSRSSHTLVRVRCPTCRGIRSVAFRDICASGNSICKACSDIPNLAGKKYGSLTIIGPTERRCGKSMVWLCKCDCGELVYRSTGHLYEDVPHTCMRGKCNPRWNEGLSRSQRAQLRWKPRYIEWRKAVFDRDGFECKICGYDKGKILVAHHLDAWDSDIEKRFELNNGVTLCRNCHKRFHDAYGYGGNTRQQFDEFKRTYGKDSI